MAEDYYSQITKDGARRLDGYAVRRGGNFVRIVPPSYNPENLSGWKFKISVNRHDVPKAWNIMLDLLKSQKHIPVMAKVAHPDGIDSIMDGRFSSGKLIVLYTDNRVSPDHYRVFLNMLEDQLNQHGIHPGGPIRGERAVPNSAYFFYRNDRDLESNYSSAREGKDHYNPYGHEDPYENFAIWRPADTVIPDETLPGFLKYEWAGATKDKERGPSARLGVGDMPEHEVTGLLMELSDSGFHPQLRSSQTLKRAVYLEGDEALRLAAMRRMMMKSDI